MNFKSAVDQLCASVDHEDVAKALGVSIQSVRQARLSPDARAYRQPPTGWQEVVVKLAEKQIAHYRKLVERVREQRS